MRISALPTLFFSLFFAEMAFCIPLLTPDRGYAPNTRETLGLQNMRIINLVTSPIGMFLGELSMPTLRGMQLQIDDYCSKFPCPMPRGTSEI
ncbi:hypothetical protein BDR04DRAFT_1105295 [Suillus decipiens]|nr:hypothetical protein BDR04DRAFT_1105295 [Suillus decipiens]